MEDIKIAIIGTAGRKEDGAKMTKEIYEKMIYAVRYIIISHFGLDISKVTLVSGGAAWADHIAVNLYNYGYVKDLILHLPCEWNNGKYLDTGSRDWRVNPGKTSNYYHEQFSGKVGVNTLNEIENAKVKGCKLIMDSKGFHNRNNEVSKASYMIALTWGEGSEPKDGGTLHTWKLCNGNKIHLPLSQVAQIVMPVLIQ